MSENELRQHSDDFEAEAINDEMPRLEIDVEDIEMTLQQDTEYSPTIQKQDRGKIFNK